MSLSDHHREHEHPEFQAGKTAYAAGITLDENPHRYGSDEYHSWAQGWQEGLSKENA